MEQTETAAMVPVMAGPEDPAEWEESAVLVASGEPGGMSRLAKPCAGT